jgi:hypothetical protein
MSGIGPFAPSRSSRRRRYLQVAIHSLVEPDRPVDGPVFRPSLSSDETVYETIGAGPAIGRWHTNRDDEQCGRATAQRRICAPTAPTLRGGELSVAIGKTFAATVRSTCARHHGIRHREIRQHGPRPRNWSCRERQRPEPRPHG